MQPLLKDLIGQTGIEVILYTGQEGFRVAAKLWGKEFEPVKFASSQPKDAAKCYLNHIANLEKGNYEIVGDRLVMHYNPTIGHYSEAF